MAVTNEGVLAWCDTIRFTMAKDPGRELFASQIQQHGFDFLDNYLEDVLARQPTDNLYELMKTPGKKKDAPKRTRAATAVAAKLKALNGAIFEDQGDDKAHAVPVNGFHKALLEIKASSDKARPPGTPLSLPAVNKVSSKIVTISDSPVRPSMDIDEVSPTISTTEPTPVSQDATSTTVIAVSTPEPEPQAPVVFQDSPPHMEPSPETTQVHETPAIQSTVPAFDSLPDEAVQSEALKELSVIAEDDEFNDPGTLPTDLPETVAPGSTMLDYNMDQDHTVPLRDSSSSGTLKRKQSVTQFSGLPAPSPLRKSMRLSREPSMGAGLMPTQTQTPGAGLGGKRTSWLIKAKEAKALEMTGSGKRLGMASEASSSHLNGLGLGLPSTLKLNSRPTSRDFSDETPKVDSATHSVPVDDNDTIMKVDQPEETSRKKSKELASPMDDDFTGRLDANQSNPSHNTWPSRTAPVALSALFDAEDMTVPLNEAAAEEGALNRLKKTLEGAGSRPFRSIGKSLGGNAAAALAEARAAAEARVAERNKDTSQDVSVVEVNASEIVEAVTSETIHEAVKPTHPPEATSPSPEPNRRFSLSELVSTSTSKKVEREPGTDMALLKKGQDADTSTSTTPPNSPPAIVQKPAVPIFKPTVAPVAAAASKASAEAKIPPTSSMQNFAFKLPSTNPFAVPPPDALRVHTTGLAPTISQQTPALSAQSSKASIFSDAVFDKEDSARAWMPTTQDTDYSTNPSKTQDEEELVDDDSWHLDEKFRANENWTPYGFSSNDKEDNTWSTLPSRSTSQHGDTATMQQGAHEVSENYVVHQDDDDQGTFNFGQDFDKAHVDVNDLDDIDMEVDEAADQVDDLDDIVAAGKSTITLVTSSSGTHSQSQVSLNSTSTSSSQGNVGFLGQASRFVSSMLGSSKTKGKNEPPKSIVRAAAAAKKQQEEADRKAQRLREMENRRQLATQRKAEEEKARTEEQEKRIKEENEKRKRDRDEQNTGKLPAVKPVKKQAEDDTMGKRKMADAQKKPESKKPPSKEAQPPRSIKPPSTSSNAPGTSSKLGATLKANLAKHASTSSLAAPSTTKEPPAAKPTPASTLKVGPPKGKAKAVDRDDAQPSQILQSQMAERAKAQAQAAQTPRQPPPVTSESIELPDINSEYSDSEDEDRPRSFIPPEWAQSPELRQQLEDQSRYNPDDIFGRIGPLRMEEIFRTRQSRFRARTSSANWAGTDELTEYEEREYARRMGYNNKS